MIIRSQNKKGIVNLNNIDTICIEPNHCGCDVLCFNGAEESRSKIGEYSTEEKAIKVLDMICKEYKRTTDLDHECKSSILFCVPRSNVFQMPQDSEV